MNEVNYEQKYSRDGANGETITLGEIIKKVLAKIPAGDDAILDELDKEFFYGAWGSYVGEIKDPNFLRDVRGLILGIINKQSEEHDPRHWKFEWQRVARGLSGFAVGLLMTHEGKSEADAKAIVEDVTKKARLG